MSRSSSTPLTIVNVLSTGMSGSTWINLLLGSHPRCFSIGEMRGVLKYHEAVCVLHDQGCPIWSKFDPDSNENWFTQIARLTDRRIVVLNNGRKLLPMQHACGARVRFIHLMRDGRAVAASMMRKYPERSMFKASRMWRHDVKRNERLIARQPRDDCFQLSYERVKADTAGELECACRFLQIEFDPRMLEFWNVDHHYLGGNKGTLFGMTKKSGKDDPIDVRRRFEADKAPQWDLEHYRDTDPARFVDDRWKKELTGGQLRVFGLVAGRVNRKYGYR